MPCVYSLFLRSFSFWLSVAICFSSLFFVRRLQSLTYLYCKVLLLFACYSWKFVTACRDRIGHNGHMNWFCSEKLKFFLMFCAWRLLYQVIRRRRGRRGLAFKWRAPVLFVTFYFSYKWSLFPEYILNVGYICCVYVYVSLRCYVYLTLPSCWCDVHFIFLPLLTCHILDSFIPPIVP